MIRRGFWLVVGATGGIIGYRRVTALGRQLTQTLSPSSPGPLASTANRPQADGVAPSSTPDGHDRSAGPGDAALRRKALSRQARRGLVRGTIRLTRDARRFSRDVREGMDLYMVRHPRQVSPTLDPTTDNDERVKDDR